MNANPQAAFNPKVESFFHEPTATFCHVAADPGSDYCAIVDPVLDYDHSAGRTDTAFADRVAAFVTEHGLQVQWLLETHAHADHLTAAPYLKEKLGGQIAIGEYITTVQKRFGELFNTGPEFTADGSQFDRLFTDGDSFRIGNLTAHVMHTPGHTPACLTYIIEDAAFVGDTLFAPDYGTARADFPGGDARALYRSIKRILTLPGKTRLFQCHDYLPEDRQAVRPQASVDEQRAKNVHVGGDVSEEDFVRMRRERDATLEMPALLLPSIQINMRAGHLPPPESNGTVYLKTPVNQL